MSTAHNALSRREATAVPLVLSGTYGRTVASYRPADEDLTAAQPGKANWAKWSPVHGPHLRCVRGRDRRSKTGVVGISISRNSKTGRHWIVVNLGSTCRKYCVEALGSREAWRRALELRRAHVLKVAAANAVILRARAAHATTDEGRAA